MVSIEDNTNIEGIIKAYHEIILEDLHQFEQELHTKSGALVPVEYGILKTAGYFSVIEGISNHFSVTVGYTVPFLNPMSKRNKWHGTIFDYANIQHNHPSYGITYLETPFDELSKGFMERLDKDIMSCFNR